MLLVPLPHTEQGVNPGIQPPSCLPSLSRGGREPRKLACLTGKDLMLQSTTFLSGTYLALPMLALNLGESTSLGTGTVISTPLATDCFLN